MRASRGAQAEYDGVGEIWWENEEAFRAAVSSAEVEQLRDLFVQDEARFVDLANSSLFFTAEHTLVDEAAPA